MLPDTIERETVIAAPVQRVWELLTQPEHVGRWFGDAGAEVDPRPGGAMVLFWGDIAPARARIERIEPPTHFSYRWSPLKASGGEEPTPANSTLVEFTLTPTDDAGTLLRVVESGFASLDATDDQRHESLAGNTEGWKRKLDDLRDYAAQATA